MLFCMIGSFHDQLSRRIAPASLHLPLHLCLTIHLYLSFPSSCLSWNLGSGKWLSVPGACLWPVAVCNRWLSVTGGIYIPNLLFQCLEMLFTKLIHPVFAFLKRKDYYSQPNSSLRTKSSRQGCIALGFFIPADKIFPPGMHRPEIFHPCYEVTIVKKRLEEISVSVQATFVFLWQHLERALI